MLETYEITTTVLIERTYEVEAESSEEATATYFKELPAPVKEKTQDWFEGDFNVQVKIELL